MKEEYKRISDITVGQEVKIGLKVTYNTNRYVSGSVVYKDEKFITVKSKTYKESICLVDFITGHAFVENVS